MKQIDFSHICLIAVDLDGTLLDHKKVISVRTLRAIEQCRQRGLLFVFATGRGEAAAREYLDQLSPDAAVLAYGAQVMLHGETIASRYMSPRVATAVLDGLPQASRVKYQLRSGHVYDSDQAGQCQLTDRKTMVLEPLEYIAVWNLPQEEARQLARRTGCSLTQLVDDRWCNFSARGAGKGPGMRQLMKALGLAKGQAIGFGDESCDVDFFRVCGLGVAMGNADAFTLAHADYHTESNDCDGIAVFLENFLLR